MSKTGTLSQNTDFKGRTSSLLGKNTALAFGTAIANIEGVIAAIDIMPQAAPKTSTTAANDACSSSSSAPSFHDAMLAATTSATPHQQDVSSNKPQHHAKSDDDQADAKQDRSQDSSSVAVVTVPVLPAPQLPIETTPAPSIAADVTAPVCSASSDSNTLASAPGSSTPAKNDFAVVAGLAGIQVPDQDTKSDHALGTDAMQTSEPSVAESSKAADQAAATSSSAPQAAAKPDQSSQKLVDARLANILGQKITPADTKLPQSAQPVAQQASAQNDVAATASNSAGHAAAKPENTSSNVQTVNGQSTEQPANQIANPHAAVIPHIELGTSTKHTDVADENSKAVSSVTGTAVHAPAVKPARNEEANTQSQNSSSDQSKTSDAPVQQPAANGSSTFSVNTTGTAQPIHVPAPQANYSAAAHVANRPQAAVSANQVAAPVEATHVQPLINTARIIQSMHETEMRVGIRSEDFGNISISTFANRESITAQISVEHDELAKTIAAGLPDMQSRLGSDQPLQVRIASGAHAGTMDTATGSGANSNSNADNGSQWRQASSTRYQSDTSFASEPTPRVPAFVRPVNIISNSRLDITA